jgi:uncharacterized Zn finger protein
MDNSHLHTQDTEQIAALKRAIVANWSYYLQSPGSKVGQYVSKFFKCKRIVSKISGKVQGNHGTYTVTIELRNKRIVSKCSCYIGKSGGCHHCAALALTFLQKPDSFEAIQPANFEAIKTPEELQAYLKTVKLENLLEELKEQGISYQQFGDTIGLDTRKLTSLRNSEAGDKPSRELEAVKLACLWMLEHFSKKKLTCAK